MNPKTSSAKRGGRSLEHMVRRITCFLRGHPCEPTGRHAILLVEWKCKRCGGLYVSHAHHSNALMSADDGSDRIFRDCLDAIKAADAKPSNDPSSATASTARPERKGEP
jgi:hypothetical protein